MKPGKITGALGGLFGMIGSIATAAKRDPIQIRTALRDKAKKKRRNAEKALANGKRDKHRRLMDEAESIEQSLRDEGFAVEPADGLP